MYTGTIKLYDGTVDTEKSKEALDARIKNMGGCKYNYVQYNPNSTLTLQEQCKEELEYQFRDWLEDLYSNHRNLTVIGKYGNFSIFKDTKKQSLSEEELIQNQVEKDENEEVEESSLDSDLNESIKDNKDNEEKETTGVDIFTLVNPSALQLLERFFYNQAYATTQLHQLFSTSTSFYGSPIKYQKRGKEHNTPMKRLNTEVMKSEYQRVVYLKDLEIGSMYESLYEIIDNSANLSEFEKKI